MHYEISAKHIHHESVGGISGRGIVMKDKSIFVEGEEKREGTLHPRGERVVYLENPNAYVAFFMLNDRTEPVLRDYVDLKKRKEFVLKPEHLSLDININVNVDINVEGGKTNANNLNPGAQYSRNTQRKRSISRQMSVDLKSTPGTSLDNEDFSA
jgi:hypothetical protein